jgi:hypothetical protein
MREAKPLYERALAIREKALGRRASLDGRELQQSRGTAPIAGRLPVQIVSASVTLAYEARRGHLDTAELKRRRKASAVVDTFHLSLP